MPMSEDESHILDRLREFTEKLEAGEPIPIARVTRHDTPDGAMHTFEQTVIRLLPLWRCDGCGKEFRSHPVAGDDWGGEERAVGPDCPDCEQEMDAVDETASAE